MASNPTPNPTPKSTSNAAQDRPPGKPQPSVGATTYRLLVFAGALLILAGLAMGVWSLANLPFGGRAQANPNSSAAFVAATQPGAPAAENPVAPRRVDDLAAAGVEVASLPVALRVTGDPALPAGLRAGLDGLLLEAGRVTFDAAAGAGGEDAAAAPVLRLDWSATDGAPVYEEVFAVASRFDTIFPEITWDEVQGAWQGTSPTYTAVAVISSTLPALEQALGPAGSSVQGHATITEVVEAAWAETPTLAYVPFDTLVPRLASFAVDGQNPVENANKFDPARYPFTATLYAHTDGSAGPAAQEIVAAALAAAPHTNRDPNKLTVLAITGVTAMVRLMAAEMDRRGAAWPAEVVGPELATADITHISNEVPFVEDCETDVSMDNYNFCTKMEYLETLRLTGVDIIGLTGNHQNDYGPTNALKSLDFYADENLPVYGGGRNRKEAYAPFYLEHNGNRLAFLGANSYGPQMAFATETGPGSAKFDLNVMSASIREIKQDDLADVVLAELQYQESYDTMPLIDQRNDFNALVNAGADIVTGVQSHVPQAVEFTDGHLIMYGLGNLFFDQMGSTATRENLIAKHTFYNGRHISTQLLTTMLYDYGQPRWTTTEQRESLLTRIFGYSYWE